MLRRRRPARRTRQGDQAALQDRDWADVAAMLDRQPLVLRVLDQLRFLHFDVEQIALRLTFTQFAISVR
jgi:hypothetical protein